MATRPGFHATTSFTDYPSVLNPAIRAIGKSFYVTRSFQKETIGNSEYWGVLARPSDDFSVHLNADRELLFVFSRYENFEIRTLEAFDAFYRTLEHARVDKSIRFLVSADPKIEAIIQHYLSQNPEHPIIVPIILSSMSEVGTPILDSVRRNYLVRDLFGYQNPLREETFFFGRQEQVNAVLDLAKSGQSSSIFGLRKSGKTSSIYAIIRRARSFDITPVFIDCQFPAIHARRYNELLSHVIFEVRRSIGQTRAVEQLEGSEIAVAEGFRSQLKTALGQAKTRILIVFDEIENISPKTAASPHWSHGRDSLLFWQNVRSFVQQEAGGRVAICLVGTSPLLLETPKIDGVANPMYLFSQKRFIPTFSFDETREMINRLGFFMGIEIDSAKIAKLHKAYGGHPFFIRQVCSNLHRLVGHIRPVHVSDKQTDAAMEAFGAQLDNYLKEILESLRELYPEEFSLLQAIVAGEKEEVSEYGRDAPEYIDHLLGYEIIERKGEDFDIRFDAIRKALRRILVNRDIESFWTECMLRRNTIEVDIRRELLSMSRSLSAEEWSNLLREQLSRSNFEKLKSIEPRTLFSKSQSPLYWIDLLGILRSERALSYLGDRRKEVIQAMNVINSKGRKDSHANEISLDDISELRRAFSLLEAEFQQPD